MTKKLLICAFLIMMGSMRASADLRVVVSYPYIGQLVEAVAGDDVDLTVLASGAWNPHHVVPRPSFIAKLRRADVLIINGAQNEIGWLPPVVKQANNPKILPESKNFLDLATQVELLEKPTSLSRAGGDIHPEGNPHFYLSPANIPILLGSVQKLLCEADSKNCAKFEKNTQAFLKIWKERMSTWAEAMKPLAGTSVMSHHKLFNYFLEYYQIPLVNTLEPLPGVEPSPKHINSLIQEVPKHSVKVILLDVFHSKKPGKFLSDKTGVPTLVLPHDVGSFPETKTLLDLFEQLVTKLQTVAQ